MLKICDVQSRNEANQIWCPWKVLKIHIYFTIFIFARNYTQSLCSALKVSKGMKPVLGLRLQPYENSGQFYSPGPGCPLWGTSETWNLSHPFFFYSNQDSEGRDVYYLLMTTRWHQTLEFVFPWKKSTNTQCF
jgi:hypothetical protein